MANITDDPKRWTWFCNETSDNLEDEEGRLSECLLNIFACFLHLVFLMVACLVVIWIRWCCVFHRVTRKFLIRWPGHIQRCLLTFILLLCAFASLGEGLLTELVRKQGGNTQLQFYLPSCFLSLATVTSLIFYLLIEKWRTPGWGWLLVVYWLSCIGVNVARMTFLIQTAAIGVTTLWITVVLTAVYLALLVLELNLIAVKVRFSTD